jgi:hypothetical protein
MLESHLPGAASAQSLEQRATGCVAGVRFKVGTDFLYCGGSRSVLEFTKPPTRLVFGGGGVPRV